MAMAAFSVTSATQTLPLQAMSMALPTLYPNSPTIFMNLPEPISERQTFYPTSSTREECLHGR